MVTFPMSQYASGGQSIGKDPDAGKDWRQEEKGTTEDEMVGWHHWLNGHEFEQVWEIVKDKEAWRAAVHGVAKSQTRLSDWTELNWCKPNAIVKQFKLVLILKQFLPCSPDDSLDFASYLSTPLTFWTNLVVLLDFQWNFLCKYTNPELFKLWRWYHYSAHIMWLSGIFHLIQHQHMLI